MRIDLPSLPDDVPTNLTHKVSFEVAEGLAVIVGEAPDGRLMLYHSAEGGAWPLTPLMSRHDILCVAEMALQNVPRIRTWPHLDLVLAMAVALVGDDFLKPGDGAPAGGDDPPGPVAPAAEAVAVGEV